MQPQFCTAIACTASSTLIRCGVSTNVVLLLHRGDPMTRIAPLALLALAALTAPAEAQVIRGAVCLTMAN